MQLLWKAPYPRMTGFLKNGRVPRGGFSLTP
jgi:hypothetical protein